MGTYNIANTQQVADAVAAGLANAITLDGTTGTPVVRKPGDARAGVYDWLVGSGLAGYLFHLRTTADSISDEYLFGMGLDAGQGGGILLSIKGAGVGLNIQQSPLGGVGEVITAASSNAIRSVSQYIGNGGTYHRLRNIQPRVDGVTIADSTTFTSQTANFVAGDQGATIDLMPSVQVAFGGTTRTIASVTNSTTVELNAPASSSATGIQFTISNRVMPDTQIIERVLDDNGTTVLHGRYKGYTVSQPFQGRDISTPGLVTRAIASQTADLFRALAADTTTELFAIRPAGNLVATAGLDINNAQRATSSTTVVNITSSNTLSRALVVKGNNVTDTAQFQTSTGTTTVRVDKGGRLGLKVNTAPADADVNTNEGVLWIDNTAGAAKFMVKAKDSAGTVQSLSLGATAAATLPDVDFLADYNAA